MKLFLRLFLVVLLVSSTAMAQKEIHSERFSAQASDKWTDPHTQQSPNGTWLLGVFGGIPGKQETLVIKNLDKHQAVVVAVDIVFFNDWGASSNPFQIGI